MISNRGPISVLDPTEYRNQAFEGHNKLLGVIGAHHPSAGRERKRFHHTWVADLSRSLLWIVVDREALVLRRAHPGGRQGLARLVLVAGAEDREQRIVRHAQRIGGHGGQHHPVVICRDDGIERVILRELDDFVRGPFEIVKVNDQVSGGIKVGQWLILLRSDRNRHVQSGGRLQKSAGPVGLGGHQEQDPSPRAVRRSVCHAITFVSMVRGVLAHDSANCTEGLPSSGHCEARL